MLTESDFLSAKILIVDDEPAHVHLLERLLQSVGYLNVTSTMDPQQVCRLHREQAFELILLDLQMPVLDGFGVLEALQAEAGTNTVLPVIALTAQPGHKLRALQAGARDFINKPFDVVEVKIRIRHRLEVALLYKLLEAHNQELERTVQERTAALAKSEARYRSLTELATDWYWEQNDTDEFTRASGPALELLGHGEPEPEEEAGIDAGATWEVEGRESLLEKVAARRPFLDHVVQRLRADGSRQQFRVSGEPIFDTSCRYTGYRGVGVMVLPG
jgi:DNA-binding response OmpR family regulator